MAPSTVRFTDLNPSDRAEFATAARLFSCLVTESLVRAVYLPLIGGFEATGICVVLNGALSSLPPSDLACEPKDILAIIPLWHVPIFKHDGKDPRGPEIGESQKQPALNSKMKSLAKRSQVSSIRWI